MKREFLLFTIKKIPCFDMIVVVVFSADRFVADLESRTSVGVAVLHLVILSPPSPTLTSVLSPRTRKKTQVRVLHHKSTIVPSHFCIVILFEMFSDDAASSGSEDVSDKAKRVTAKPDFINCIINLFKFNRCHVFSASNSTKQASMWQV